MGEGYLNLNDNCLKFKGREEDVRRVCGCLRGKQTPFDFRKLTGLPEELYGTEKAGEYTMEAYGFLTGPINCSLTSYTAEDGDTVAVLNFQTVVLSPLPLIHEISSHFDELDFAFMWASEGTDALGGWMYYKKGELVKEMYGFMPEFSERYDSLSELVFK